MSGKHLVLFAISLLALAGCSSDDAAGGSGSSQPITATGSIVDGASVASAAMTASESDTEDAVIAPAAKARIGAVPRSASGNRDLSRELAGEEGTLEFDIDSDDELESLQIFIANIDNTVFMNWEDDDLCHLTWSQPATSWYAFSACGGGEDGTIVCQYGEAVACTQCFGDACSECQVRGDDIYCGDSAERLLEQERAAEAADQPDVGVIDTGDDDGGGESDGGGGTDTVDLPDTPVEVDAGGDNACDPSCLSETMGVCCTTCGCDAEVVCRPVCGSGYTWDCEIQCCFDYEAQTCDGE